jgi:hypothetical protein
VKYNLDLVVSIGGSLSLAEVVVRRDEYGAPTFPIATLDAR